MKIALLTGTFSAFSGIDRVVEQQARDLGKENEVTVFCLESDINSQGFKVEVLGMPKHLFWQRLYRLFFFLDFQKINRTLNRLKNFDLIYSHQYPMNHLAKKARQKFKIKYVYYNHGLPPTWTFSGLGEKIYIWLFRILTNWSAKQADEVISVSKFLAEQFFKETGRKSRVVYNQIPRQRFHRGIDGQKIRNKYNLSDNPVILYVGRLSPHKGVDLLIQSFKIVEQEVSEAKLLIVGKATFGRYLQKLKDLADQSVIFAAYVADEELPYYYAAANVYATATLWEGYNLPLAEAQAVGKPVICFNLGPHPEIVRNGELVEPKNINKFAEAIIKVLKR